MKDSEIGKVEGLSINSAKNVSSPMKSARSESEMIIMAAKESGVKPIELDDFFEFLDSKTIQKIKETSLESKARITGDIAQIEYETDGARSILNSLGW